MPGRERKTTQLPLLLLERAGSNYIIERHKLQPIGKIHPLRPPTLATKPFSSATSSWPEFLLRSMAACGSGEAAGTAAVGLA